MDPLRQIIAAIKIPDPARVRDVLRMNPELVNARDETGDSILLMSIYRRLPEIQNIILDWNPDLNLFEAAALGDVATVRKLLGLYPKLVNAYSHDGFTALHLAVFFGREETAAALLEAGADVNAVSRNQTFARHGADRHLRSDDQRLASDLAGEKGLSDIVRLLS